MRQAVAVIVAMLAAAAIALPLIHWLQPPRIVSLFVPFGLSLLCSWVLLDLAALRDKADD